MFFGRGLLNEVLTKMRIFKRIIVGTMMLLSVLKVSAQKKWIGMHLGKNEILISTTDTIRGYVDKSTGKIILRESTGKFLGEMFTQRLPDEKRGSRRCITFITVDEDGTWRKYPNVLQLSEEDKKYLLANASVYNSYPDHCSHSSHYSSN
jgi:hypothetical protein